MGSLAEQYRPAAVEKAARSLWATRGFPRADGVLGRSTAPILRQFEGTYTSGDDPTLVGIRAVAADVAARYLAIAGRRALGTLRREAEAAKDPVTTLLRSLSIWTGGESGQPYDSTERRDRIETILGRMAGRGLIVTRDAPLRICPHCAAPRSPEGIVYAEEEGDTYLVRFGIVDGDRRIQALVWVDAPWRLLGATALLLHPEIPYVVARYRRKDADELILTSRSSLARLVDWLPGAAVEVVEEHPGSHWAGRSYEYPLRAEFPMGAELTPPGGTLQTVPDVGDSGTGIVPLVPGHGGTDAQIAERIGVTGWPLVTARGQLATTLMHKYAGLDLFTASEFVLRDLGDNGVLFARLRVRRGVPHCAICATSMVWAPGRAWCLEPSRLPPERRATYLRLLPHDPPMSQIEVAAWPVSESTSQAPGPRNATLLECPGCERLEPLGGDPTCPCGGTRRAVSRRLLPAIRGVLAAWARFDPFPPGDSVWIYLNERRRAPALTHHLAVMSGVAGAPSDAGLTVLPGCSTSPITERVEIDGADAVRCALVRGEAAQGTGSQLPERSAQEARRLEHYWQHAQEILQRIDPALLTAFLPSITGFLSELEVEDRAVLARWERARVAILADYDARDYAAAYRRLSRFLANDLPRYRALVAPRLDPSAGGAPRRAALRTLHHLVRRSSLLLGPIAPHTAELVYGATTSAGTSLFEASVEPVNASLMDEERARAWDRWRTVLEALDRFRGSLGISLHTPLPAVVVIVSIEELAELLRHDRPTLERLARVDRFEAFGPATPWTGRRADLEPVLSEIQRVYPTEATQIVHLLRRQPVHRRDGPRLSGELSVVLQGTPRRILPSMVTYVERLPDRALPASWRLGEMYVELPAGHPLPSRIPPPLSPDAFRLVQHVERELRQRSTPQSPPRPPLVIATLDPLASELRRVAPALATYLDVPELRVVDDVREFPLTETTHGRTKTGVRWWLHLPGLPRRPGHVKHPPARSPGSRLRPPQPAEETGEISVDYIAPEYLAREEQVRALMAELDGVLGAPLLGFAKTAGAWDAGLQSRAAFEAAPFDTLAALPGFGWPLAKALVVKFGHAAPVRPRWESGRRDLPLDPPARAPLRTSTQGSGEGNGTGKAMAPPHFDGAALPSAAKDETSMPSAEPKPPTSERRPAGRLEPGPASSPRPALETAVSPLPPSPMAEPAPTPPPEDEDARAGETTHRARAEPSLEIAFPPPTPSLEPDQSPRLPLEAGPRLDAEGTPGLPSSTDSASPINMAPPPAGTSSSSPVGPELATVSPDSGPGPGPSPTTSPGPGGDEPVETALASGSQPFGIESAPEEGTASPVELERTPSVLLEEPPFAPEGADSESPGDAPTLPEGGVAPGDRARSASVSEAAPGTEASGLAPPLDSHAPPALVLEPTAGPEASRPPEAAPGPDGIREPLPPTATEGPPASGAPPLPDAAELDTVRETQPRPLEPALAVRPEMAPSLPLEPSTAGAPASGAAPTPAVEAAAPPVSNPWGVEVVVSPSYLPPLREFLDMTAAGHRGVAIVRESPERLRTHIGPRPAEVYWLTNLGRGLTIKPNDLPAYGAFLEASVERDRVTAFFLEGIEYLVRLHGIDRMVELLAAFHRQAVAHEARVWVCVHPNLMAPADVERLVGAFAH